MKMKKNILVILMVLAVVGAVLLANGCKKSGKEAPKAAQAVAATVELCTACGQIKGSDVCCLPNQTLCSMCGLVKGSPGCCKLPAK